MKTAIYTIAALLAFSGAALADRCSTQSTYGMEMLGNSAKSHGLFIKKTSSDKSGEDSRLK